MRRSKEERPMYSEKVMDHFSNPRNVGEIVDANGIGEVGNAKCGDIMKMYLKIEDNVIKDVKFKTFGCGAAIATSSIATEMIKGKTVEEALELTNKAVIEALDGLPPAKIHCSVLAEDAVKAAIEDYMKNQGKEIESPEAAKFEPDEDECCSRCEHKCN
jgi:nitrogen fixation NifU-like protein